MQAKIRTVIMRGGTSRCEDIGLSGQELPDQVDSNQGLLQRIEAIRAAAGVTIGLQGVSRKQHAACLRSRRSPL
jgi:2-methylaconitate cis-trans-isomerase PrpF